MIKYKNYKEATQHLSKSVAAILSSTGSYTSKEHRTTAIFEDDVSRKSREYEGILRNPVIILHGFFGAKLVDSTSGINLWGDFGLRDAFTPTPEKMSKLAFSMSPETPLSKINDDIVAAGLLEEINIHFMGLPLKFPAYKDMVDIMEKIGFQAENRPLRANRKFDSLFLFDYDWRQDLATTAARLKSFIATKKSYLQQKYEELYGVKNYNVQFDLIAHSMGGLVARYFLQYGDQDLPDKIGDLPTLDWRGVKDIDKVIMVGTPNAGYLDTFIELLSGSPQQPYPTAVLGTLPSYYQMLPTPASNAVVYSTAVNNERQVDIFDPEVWQRMRWGLMGDDIDDILTVLLPEVDTAEKRQTIAREHLGKCLARARQFNSAMSIIAEPPAEISFHLVAGNGIKTSRQATVDPQSGEVKIVQYATGDGKVTTASALWDNMALTGNELYHCTPRIKWSTIMLLRSAHMGITNASGFEDNLRLLLSVNPRDFAPAG